MLRLGDGDGGNVTSPVALSNAYVGPRAGAKYLYLYLFLASTPSFC